MNLLCKPLARFFLFGRRRRFRICLKFGIPDYFLARLSGKQHNDWSRVKFPKVWIESSAHLCLSLCLRVLLRVELDMCDTKTSG